MAEPTEHDSHRDAWSDDDGESISGAEFGQPKQAPTGLYAQFTSGQRERDASMAIARRRASSLVSSLRTLAASGAWESSTSLGTSTLFGTASQRWHSDSDLGLPKDKVEVKPGYIFDEPLYEGIDDDVDDSVSTTPPTSTLTVSRPHSIIHKVSLAFRRSDASDASPTPSLSDAAPARVVSPLAELRALCLHRSSFRTDPTPTGYLPDLTWDVSARDARAVRGGGYGEVWRGVWRTGSYDIPVAIKVLRMYLDDHGQGLLTKRRRLHREIATWAKLDHPNIVPLFGITNGFGPFAAMVCPWQEQGNLTQLLERKHETLDLKDRSRMLLEIGSGLHYLHMHGIIHGDLTGSNVMINSLGSCCLIDFGLSSILDSGDGGSSESAKGAMRWAAPELHRFDWDEGLARRSPRNDIFSLGSIILQTLTGKIPYYRDSELHVVAKVVMGVLPEAPPGAPVPDRYADLMVWCWAAVPEERPSIVDVLTYLQHEHDVASGSASVVSSACRKEA